MRIVPFAETSAAEWNRLAACSEDAWFFHRREWIEIERDQLGAECHAFAIETDAGVSVGILPLYRQELALGPFTEKLLHSGLHRHTGLALDGTLAPEQLDAARRCAMSHVLGLAAELDVDRVQLNSQNLAPKNLGPDRDEAPFWVREHGFSLGLGFGPSGITPAPGLATVCADQVVELDAADEDEQFARLDSACRRAVRKARKNGVTADWIETLDTDAAVDRYLALARLSAERTGEVLAPRDYYRCIFTMGDARRVLVARHAGRDVAALLMLSDKRALHFLGGVSDPAALPLRVNDFLHWTAIARARELGFDHYRLGPIFPELPREWPVARVSRFKGKFGGRSYGVIQGSFFRHPKKYAAVARQAAEDMQSANAEPVDGCSESRSASSRLNVALAVEGRSDLVRILRSYGAVDLPLRFCDVGTDAAAGDATAVIFVAPDGSGSPGSVECAVQSGRRLYRDSTGTPMYHALLPHVTFRGEGVQPIWTDSDGGAVIAWFESVERRALLIGLDVVEEIVRHRQGDPTRVDSDEDRARYGFEFERPNYLFEHQLVDDLRTIPWSDRLGFLLAETLAELCSWPLLEPLPGGARGCVMLTGDDDQAFLEKYDEQLQVTRDLPLTYYLVPQTRHTAETIAALPERVVIGVHVDALEEPGQYGALCVEQTQFVRDLSGQRSRTLRNHGFLNDGYLGHLPAWEKSGIVLDVNLPGVDGTALNGSFLPMQLRRPDGTWSDHYTLLTAFGDGMIYALPLNERQGARRIRDLARQIERTRPGVLVFNFHPQNVSETLRLHRAVRRVARRKGWVAVDAEEYLDWLLALETLRVDRDEGGFSLRASGHIEGLVLRMPGSEERVVVPPWTDSTTVAGATRTP